MNQVYIIKFRITSHLIIEIENKLISTNLWKTKAICVTSVMYGENDFVSDYFSCRVQVHYSCQLVLRSFHFSTYIASSSNVGVIRLINSDYLHLVSSY